MAINEPVITLEQKVKEIQASVRNLTDARTIPIQLFMIGTILKRDTKSVYQSIGPLEVPIDGQVQDWLFTNVVKKYIDTVNDKELYDLEEVDEPGESILRRISLDHIQELKNWMAAIQNGNCPSVRETLKRDDFKPKVIVMQISLEDQNLYLMKMLNESALLRNKKILKIVNQDSFTIDPAGTQNIILDELWDAILIGEQLVLFRERNVLELFRYYATVWNDAQIALEQLENTQLLANFQQVSEYVCGHIRYQKKLARLQSFSMDQGQKTQLLHLIRIGKINLHVDDAGQIVCDSDKEIRVLLDVVFDNYVKSMITNAEYKAVNKAKLETS